MYRSNVRRKRKRRQNSGYLTVEAALVMPMVLCLYVMLIFSAYYLSDRCMSAQDSYLLVFRQSCDKTGQDVKEGIRQMEQTQYGEKYIALRSRNTTLSQSGKYIVLDGSASEGTTLFSSYWLMPAGPWQYTIHARARRSDPAKVIRFLRRMMYLAGRTRDLLTSGEEELWNTVIIMIPPATIWF